MQDLIINALTNLHAEFQKDELAFLALTTKIELPLRDRWAFSLYREINETYNVSKEWKRTDLAILQDQDPKFLIELKAMYSFDAALDADGIGGFTDAMSVDEEKAKKLANSDTTIFTVLLATHPHSLIPSSLNGIVKYVPRINKAINKFGSSDEVKQVAFNVVSTALKDRNIVATGALDGGKAFDTPVSILFWVVKT